MYFSVIVPVYGVEPYLKTCVDSILRQTFKDFELILVDDESPDGCPAICDAYAAKDHRVHVIHKKNGRAVEARRVGVLASKGRYIIFVDGDDWIAPQFLERGYTLMEQTQADIVLFACSMEYSDHSEVRYEVVAEGLYERDEIKKQIYPALLMNVRMEHMLYYVSGKIFCRSLAEKGYLAVNTKISLGEDMLCAVLAYLEAQRVYISREALNFYRIREQSGSHGFQLRYYHQISLVLRELQMLSKTVENNELPKDFERQIDRYGAYMCFVSMVHAVNDGQLCQLGEIRRQMKRLQFQKCISQAKFKGITPKTRITYFLFKKNQILLSYLFLWICQKVKGIDKKKE
ncbi:MAG: glycosyltransferase family 2 protein [Lachnospiraceae bacterium]|jgi:glycosyltransferase involved in cell wall biosynthesis|nr:glycosyltransferase family 2 protein [Lachnospiraceae bacterium]